FGIEVTVNGIRVRQVPLVRWSLNQGDRGGYVPVPDKVNLIAVNPNSLAGGNDSIEILPFDTAHTRVEIDGHTVPPFDSDPTLQYMIDEMVGKKYDDNGPFNVFLMSPLTQTGQNQDSGNDVFDVEEGD